MLLRMAVCSLSLIGNVENVWDRRHATAARAASAPGIGLPGQEVAIFIGADFHPRKSRRSRAGDFEFGATLEHHLYRLAAGLLGELGGDDAPAIGTNLLPKPPPTFCCRM